MFWPDTGTGVDVEPARKPVAAAVRKFFTEGGVGVPPTVPGGDWFNQITSELLNVLAAAGIDPSKADDDQLAAAIGAISSGFSESLHLLLSGEEGSKHLGHMGDIDGEVERNQHDINGDVITIMNFGGMDDAIGNSGVNATNNFTAISKYISHLSSNGGCARFPMRGTGGYYINGNELYDLLSRVELVVDDGVYFILDGSWTPLITKGIKVNREVRIHIVNHNYDFYIGPHQYRRPSELFPAISQIGGTFEVPKSIFGTDFFGYLLGSANGRDPVVITTSVDSISIPFTSASESKIAVVGCRIGDEIGFTNSAHDGVIMVGVVTPLGYAIVEHNLTNYATVLNKSGLLSTVYMTDFIGDRNRFNLAVLSIRVVSDRKFCVMVNDISIGVFDAGGPISGIAIGAKETTTTFVASDIYKVENSKINGSRPLRILALGDSTSDPDVPCSQFDYMTQFLAAAGCQVVHLNNLSVSGETSTQQKTRFDAIGISGYDICISQVGINDIQGGVSVDTFIANLEGIADRCHANGVAFIAGIPTLWYPKSEANSYGGGGQDTANDAAGAIYRARLRKSMAAKNCVVSSSAIRHEGVISGALLANAGVDCVLMDNIHPSAYGRMMMGLGSAMSVLGVVNPAGYRSRDVVPVPSRWASAATSGSSVLPNLIIDNGELTLIGSVNVSNSVPDGTVLLNIDKELMNGTYVFFTVPAQSASGPFGFCNIVAFPDGSLRAFSVPAGTTNITLDNITVKKLN